MKHSTQELIETVYQYFPRNLTGRDPQYGRTTEWERQRAARVSASARYDDWRGLLRRLQARYPRQNFPEVEIHDRSLFLRSPTAAEHLDRCFTGQVWLPFHAPSEKHHMLEFLVSFVVPYYILRSERQIPVEPRAGELGIRFDTSFDLTPDDVPFANAIVEEIEQTFPGHEPMDPQVGLTVVPDVVAGGKWFGEATLFTCLFSDAW